MHVRRDMMVSMIANQMMKGPRSGRHAPNSTSAQRAAFLETHLPLIIRILEKAPRGSAAIGAVVAKCAIKFGEEKALAFAEAVKLGKFQGVKDPVHLFWNYLLKSKGRDSKEIYLMAVTACRAFCEGREISVLKKASKDIFEWDANWQYNSSGEKDENNGNDK